MNEWTTQIISKYDVDHNLILAIIKTESGGEPFAVRYEPAWKYFHFAREFASRIGCTVETEKVFQATSWGLMQVMGSVAREYGFEGWLPELTRPELSVHYGVMHIKKFLQKYSTMEDAVAAYNAGSVRKTKGGMYENQLYVDKVMREYRNLGGL